MKDIVFYKQATKMYAGELMKKGISIATTNTLLHIKPLLINRSVVIVEQNNQTLKSDINICYDKIRIYQNITGKCVLIYNWDNVLVELILDNPCTTYDSNIANINNDKEQLFELFYQIIQNAQ